MENLVEEEWAGFAEKKFYGLMNRYSFGYLLESLSLLE